MRFAFALVSLVVPLIANGQPLDDGPKSPQDSLKCIKVRPGFVVELMAHEPVVQDPIAFAWGPDGKFWVVEMGDYPLGTPDKKGGGRIKILEKSRADGPYDKATLFMEGLSFPTGVTPWKKGVLVTCAPDIFYAEDADGDGKADKKEVFFTGFKAGNQQHRVNGLVYGLDGWYYGANGDSGGEVTSVKTGKKVDIRGRDFRLKPDTGEFETATGQTQFGRCRDDFGNWFGCNNTNPLYHFVLEEHYMRRNPYLIPPAAKIDVSATPGASRVYPISKPQPRFNSPAGLNHFTSACSAMIYRDDFFGPEFYGNSFVCEPVHNLIHREIMERKGITFTSRRAADEKESEFLASSDNWFRPTTVALGPDGCLWIADMYRQVIEHPEWIPKDWQKKVDIRAGHDKGRIYRVRPIKYAPREVPQLVEPRSRLLEEALAHPSGWVRDHAVRLIAEYPSALSRAKIVTLLAKHREPKVRVAALAALPLGDDSAEVVMKALDDPYPEVRKAALATFDLGRARWDIGSLPSKVGRLLFDDSPVVRQQAAALCGRLGIHVPMESLAESTAKFRKEAEFVAMVLSSLNANTAPRFLSNFLQRTDEVPQAVMLYAARLGPEPVLAIVAHRLSKKDLPDEEAMASLIAAASLLPKGPKSPVDWLKEAVGKQDANIVSQVLALADRARTILQDEAATEAKRIRAIEFLNGLGDTVDDIRLIAPFLGAQNSGALQEAAVTALAQPADPARAILVFRSWKVLSPKRRTTVLDYVLSSPLSTRILLDQLDSKHIAPAEIDSIRRTKLTDHPERAIRERARKLFGAATDADRAKVVNDYWLHQFKKVDSASGAKIFAKHCAVCHKFDGKGQDVGPDLASVKDRSPEALLVAILDPNRAVEARYLNYVAVTKSGKTLTGILAQETGNSITLVAADGKRHDLLRTDLESLASTGKSLMPEGMEKELPPRDFADLIEYLRK
ncbi:MAG: c-type cytochrome [Gemmataceae bacterium]|nr:c-type cytochrome [Gemmataceae bacterium]